MRSTSGSYRLAIECVLADPDQLRRLLNRVLGVGGTTIRDLVAQTNDEAEELRVAAGDEIDDKSQASSVVKLVNELIVEAIQQRASDIHIEPEKLELIVRFRVMVFYRNNTYLPIFNDFERLLSVASRSWRN